MQISAELVLALYVNKFQPVIQDELGVGFRNKLICSNTKAATKMTVLTMFHMIYGGK